MRGGLACRRCSCRTCVRSRSEGFGRRRHLHRRLRLAGERARRGRGARAGGPGRRARRRSSTTTRTIRRWCATRRTSATFTRRRWITRSPPRSCATGTSPTRRPQAPDLLAVDLSSERVRLGATDHRRHPQRAVARRAARLPAGARAARRADVFLDRLIYDLRRAFPLAGNRNTSTAGDRPGRDDHESGGAQRRRRRGLRRHIDKTGQATYPYGLVGLPALSELVAAGFAAGRRRSARSWTGASTEMRRVADAVADLSIAEGVYQVVRGNYDRAAGTLDALSKGTHPPLPEVSDDAAQRHDADASRRRCTCAVGCCRPIPRTRRRARRVSPLWRLDRQRNCPTRRRVFAQVYVAGPRRA